MPRTDRAIAKARPNVAPAVTKGEAEPYVRTEAEHEQIRAFSSRRKSLPILPLIKVQPDGSIDFNHPDEDVAMLLMLEALGLSHSSQLNDFVHRMVELTMEEGKVSEILVNRFLSFVADLQPRNAVEAMLAVQMVAIHNATIVQARRLRGAETVLQMESNGTLLSKLARTFTMQAEAMKKIRSGGEQKVVVEHRHYHVHPGGQAVFGDVTTGDGGGGASEVESHEPERLRLPEGAPVLSAIEANRVPVPSASDDGLERVPVPRRSRRGPLRAV